MLKAYKSDTE